MITIPDTAAELIENAETLDESLEALEQDGLIERSGEVRGGQRVYRLTSAGKAVLALRSRIEKLSRDLALAESRVEQLELELVAAGVMDPELGP